MNLLALEAGNSNIVCGLFQGEELVRNWRLQTVRDRTSDEYGALIRLLMGSEFHADAAVLATVVPPLRHTLETLCSDHLGVAALVVTPEIVYRRMPSDYSATADLGVDRILNAFAAFQCFGGPVIAVDLGTASTFDAVSADGHYLGGAIAPGIGVSMDALTARAPRLPQIAFEQPARAIGRTTVESLHAGCVYGFVGQIRELIQRFREEIGACARTVATGGFAGRLAPLCDCIDEVDPWLMLRGLRMIWEQTAMEAA